MWRFSEWKIGTVVAARSSRRAFRASDHQITNSSTHHLQVEAGFTLIELMVVAAILIALAGVGLVNYRNSKTRASEAVLATDLFNMRDAIDQYYAEKGQYPGALEELVSGGFLRKIPDDPFTMSASTWRTIPSEPDPNSPSAPPGIYNVLSGSDGTALDGTKYAEWR